MLPLRNLARTPSLQRRDLRVSSVATYRSRSTLLTVGSLITESSPRTNSAIPSTAPIQPTDVFTAKPHSIPLFKKSQKPNTTTISLTARTSTTLATIVPACRPPATLVSALLLSKPIFVRVISERWLNTLVSKTPKSLRQHVFRAVSLTVHISLRNVWRRSKQQKMSSPTLVLLNIAYATTKRWRVSKSLRRKCHMLSKLLRSLMNGYALAAIASFLLILAVSDLGH